MYYFNVFGTEIKTIPISITGVYMMPVIFILFLIILVHAISCIKNVVYGDEYEASVDFKKARMFFVMLFIMLILAFNI